jgi:AcrR family transcriptional regulator
MAADEQVRLRADARRNRDQILAAARTAFVELGPDVPMEEVARRATVGVGTLYRRFPDREALILAVAQDNFRAVVSEARTALDEEPTAWQALVRLLRRSRDLRLTIQMAWLSPTSWATVKQDPVIWRLRDDLMALVDDIVHRAQQEGSLRADIGGGDVAVLVSLLTRRLPVGSDAVADIMLDRALGLIIDGLHATPTTPLPGRRVTMADFGFQHRPGPGNPVSPAAGDAGQSSA